MKKTHALKGQRIIVVHGCCRPHGRGTACSADLSHQWCDKGLDGQRPFKGEE